MPVQNITVVNNSNQDVTINVTLPIFNNIDNIMINYQVWLIYGNVMQNVGCGTNTDSIQDTFRLPVLANQMIGKVLRIDYTLINGNNVQVSFDCTINNVTNTLNEILQNTISISCFKFI